MSKRTPLLVLVWLLTAWEVLTMGAAGSSKFTNSALWQGHFSSWGYPVWGAGVVGVAELVGVVLLLVPRTAPFAAGGLIAIMIGALATVLVHHSDLGWFAPALHITLLSAIVWLRLRLMGSNSAE